MPKIFGRILKKQKIEGKIIRVNLIIEEDTDNQFCIQTRPNNFHKIIDLDTGDFVQIEYRNEISEHDKNTFNNLILENIQKIR
ncbi:MULTISPECIES: hypothetical protein [Chryseobacterium]|uniref:Uncharacterized protein n=2 Tax=Chryseobacterium TaxID=59732 RepID=A0A6N4X821_9FLAO|nr:MULTISPECIES: hypothetical protein [Chryseobacterium]RMZ58981.1 hypothetical protein D1632_15560 [Chryseobacterium nematophagum]CAA7195428.1 hypothetical protein CHRY9293_01627 [Chryseobacterium potabilaquae]